LCRILEGVDDCTSRITNSLLKQQKPIPRLTTRHRGTTTSLTPAFTRILSRIDSPPLLFTIFLGTNDASPNHPVGVPLPTYAANIHAFVSTLLTNSSTRQTKILLITPPPINAPEAAPCDKFATSSAEAAQYEQECRKSAGFRIWAAKKEYADKVIEIAESYHEEERVGVFDFWRALTDYGLMKEGRNVLQPGPVDVSLNGRWPGSGLPGAKEFEKGVFGDRLHLSQTVGFVIPSVVPGH
jgi:lysophospholipase L1-like esterase